MRRTGQPIKLIPLSLSDNHVRCGLDHDGPKSNWWMIKNNSNNKMKVENVVPWAAFSEHSSCAPDAWEGVTALHMEFVPWSSIYFLLFPLRAPSLYPVWYSPISSLFSVFLYFCFLHLMIRDLVSWTSPPTPICYLFSSWLFMTRFYKGWSDLVLSLISHCSHFNLALTNLCSHLIRLYLSFVWASLSSSLSPCWECWQLPSRNSCHLCLLWFPAFFFLIACVTFFPSGFIPLPLPSGVFSGYRCSFIPSTARVSAINHISYFFIVVLLCTPPPFINLKNYIIMQASICSYVLNLLQLLWLFMYLFCKLSYSSL